MRPTTQRRTARFGVFEADLDSRQLTKSGLRIRLQDQPFQLLALLVERQGQVVTREELKEELWPGNTFVEFDAGLNTAVKKLRTALSDSSDNPRFVETVPRVGYRFVAPVTISETDPVASTVRPGLVDKFSEEFSQPPSSEERAASPAGILPATRGRLVLFVGIILAFALLIAGIAIRTKLKTDISASSVQAIAVLPLLNVSTDPAQEYFADGMTDEIITDLAKLAGPKVISRTSAMQYKGTHKTIPEVARELHVGVVLEGSVERSGDRMRVRVQLIEAATDQHLWAVSYDRQISDVLLLESELAQDIARQIEIRLTPQQQQNLTSKRALNPQAFQDYLQGRHYWAIRTDESLAKAVEYFNRAIQEDPTDARSYAGLAQCYIVLPMLTTTPQAEALPKAHDAAAKALNLDDSLAEAHLSVAEVRFYQDWDFVGAEQEFKKTLDLNPNYSTGHQWYGEFLSVLGRHEEAFHELESALALDPLSAIVHLQFGNTLQQARQYDRALEQYRETLRLDPKLSAPFYQTFWIYRRQGKYAQSISPLRTAVQAWDKNGNLVALVDQLRPSYSSGGRIAYLRQCIKIHEHFGRPWFYLALDYADLGDREAALAKLNTSYQNRETEFLGLLIDPELDSLRSDARFQELQRRAGFQR